MKKALISDLKISDIVKRFSPLLLVLLIMIGCAEDEIDITVNTDGSGTVYRKLTISERLVVASSEKTPGGSGKMDIPTKLSEVKEKVGDSFTITDMKAKDQKDGSKVIEIRGSFKSAQQFFGSKFAQKELNLSWQRNGTGKMELHFSGKTGGTSGGMGPKLRQLYGAMKGMYLRRSITLPSKLSGSQYGTLDQGGKRISWTLDLRDRKALEKSILFVEGKDKGNDKVILADKLSFDVPLGTQSFPSTVASSSQNSVKNKVNTGPTSLKLEPISLNWERNKALKKDAHTFPSELTIEFKLSWPENQKPIAYYKPQLESASDDKGNSLMKKSSFSDSRNDIGKYSKKDTTIRMDMASPASGAKFLTNVKGYVNVITKTETKTVTINDVMNQTDKEFKDIPALMVLGLKIPKIKDRQITIEMADQKQKIAGLTLIKKNGKRLDKNGYSGWKNQYSYYFKENVEAGDKLEIRLRIKDEITKLPIQFDKLALP